MTLTSPCRHGKVVTPILDLLSGAGQSAWWQMCAAHLDGNANGTALGSQWYCILPAARMLELICQPYVTRSQTSLAGAMCAVCTTLGAVGLMTADVGGEKGAGHLHSHAAGLTHWFPGHAMVDWLHAPVMHKLGNSCNCQQLVPSTSHQTPHSPAADPFVGATGNHSMHIPEIPKEISGLRWVG